MSAQYHNFFREHPLILDLSVPIRLAIPPIEALYAIASINAFEKIEFSFSIVLGLSAVLQQQYQQVISLLQLQY